MRASSRQGKRQLRVRPASNSYPWWGVGSQLLTLCLPIRMFGAERIGRQDVFRELRGVVSGEEGKKLMKTPSGTFAYLILAIVATLAVVSCVTYQFVANQQAFLVIGNGITYVKWKSQHQFDNALKRVCQHGGNYDLTVLVDEHAQPIHPYKPCPFPGSIRTVKVTKSNVAAAAPPGDPHVTMKVASPDPQDIGAVADALTK